MWYILCFLAVLFFVLCLFFAWTTVLLIWSKIPFIRSSQKRIDMMIQLASLQKGDCVYDLGSGLGDVLFALDDFPVRGYGYELVYPVYILSCWRRWYRKSPATIYHGNFFKADFSQANVLFCYLVPSLMHRFSKEIWPHLPIGTRVISHAFQIPNHTPDEVLFDGHVRIALYVKKA